MKNIVSAMRIVCAVVGSFVFSSSVLAQTSLSSATAAPTTQTPSSWTPEDMVFFDTADQFRISPTGKWTLWLKTVPDKKSDSRISQLMLSSMTDSTETQLTRERDNIVQPRWSPDGKLIAFLSSRVLPDGASGRENTHIWIINPFGGEPWPVLTSDLRIRHFEWLGSDTIILSAAEDRSLHESQTDEKKDDTNVVDDSQHTPPVRLFNLSLTDKRVTRITTNDRWIENFEVSPDGQNIVASESRELSYQYDRKISPAIWILNLAKGQRKQIFTENNVHPRVVKWAADNSGVYAIAPYSHLMAEPSGFARLVYFYDVSTGTQSKVELDWEKGVGFLQRFEITPDGFMVLLADGVRFKPARYVRHGATWSREWMEGEHVRNYFNFTLSQDAQSIVYEYSTASVPWQWYRAELDGTQIKRAVILVDLYKTYRSTKVLAKTDIIRWKGANDEDVDGILYYPDHYEAGKRYPLVTYTHGGPMGADLDAWSANPAYAANLLTSRDAFVLETNYHGSANYGAAWAESICCGHYYELEIPDIQKGVDSLIAKGLVDADRIAAFGWSNGAILSIQLNVEDPKRYKATVVGAGDVEYVSDWGNSEYGEAFDNFYFGKTPFDAAELYIRKSPIYKLDRVRTPTLIFHGTEDHNVPTSQGWLHYRSLAYLDKAPVRFLLFPGEAHFPLKLSHQLRVTTEEMAWFDKYLFRAEPTKNEAIKENSPLAQMLQHPALRTGTRYGISVKGKASSSASTAIVVPEMVDRPNIQVGRFEVTRAQYAAFDKNYRYEPSEENYPASGISFEQAQAYCVWLSQLTNHAYRLPYASEVKSLYLSHSGENTLDYWAGYSVNPDDADKLASVIDAASPDELLKPVGSFPGTAGPGEAPLFDLGGNVAEWVQIADGKGDLFGGSADRPADSKAEQVRPRPAYAGFRVVSGAATTK
jgi:dipeptidyl aminopeptidase/acylaminoacyl peptidase